jgi:ubiquinone/menaquinone biosynthesis C-methylase UbiE
MPDRDFQSDYCELIIKHGQLKPIENQIVLDVGCGAGEICARLGRSSTFVVGVDIQRYRSWTLHSKCDFVLADAHLLPFKSETFDVVFEKDMIHHVTDRHPVLSEMKRVARKISRISVIEANRYNPIMFFHMTLLLGHDHLTQLEFTNLISSCFGSFSVESIETHAWPVRVEVARRFLRGLEMVMQTIPMLNRYRSYNIGLVSLNG